MAALRTWYVIVKMAPHHPHGRPSKITFWQNTDTMDKALSLTSVEMAERFRMTTGYEFIECGIKEGPDA